MRVLCPLIVCANFLFHSLSTVAAADDAAKLEPIKHNNPGLVVDLGVGLWSWPLPMDYDGDGDWDLVVSCPDKPYKGTYFFENPDGNVLQPVFKPGVRIGTGYQNIRVSFVDSQPRVMTPAREFAGFLKQQFQQPVKLPLPENIHETAGKIRANQWTYCDYDGDEVFDLIVGVDDWSEYGWDDAFNSKGEWTRGPLRGFVYLLRNAGTNGAPRYETAVKVVAGDKPVEVYGWPSPNFADFDGDDDLDLLCGEFLDRFTYFENVGTRTQPKYAAGRFLTKGDAPLTMDLQMIVPSAVDWDRDGDVDLIVGDEDGRVALIEHTGDVADGMPRFKPPVYFQQQADLVKFGALATPYGVDWDGDGDEDIISGNTAGYIGFIENLGGGESPKWARPVLLEADGEVIRIQAGPNGSIQGPCEAKWGYTTLSVADWNQDELPDIIANSIWGKVVWFQNMGTRSQPKLAAAQPIEVEWTGPAPKPAWNWWSPDGKKLATQWRTTPVVVDFNGDKLNDLVMLDHEGYLAFFERKRADDQLQLTPPQRMFVDANGQPTQLNPGYAGKSGRRKLTCVDWDGDGRLDFLLNGKNAEFWRNVETRGDQIVLENKGPLDAREMAGHDTSPTTVDWNKDGIRDLLVSGEDGHLYYMRNERKP